MIVTVESLLWFAIPTLVSIAIYFALFKLFGWSVVGSSPADTFINVLCAMLAQAGLMAIVVTGILLAMIVFDVHDVCAGRDYPNAVIPWDFQDACTGLMNVLRVSVGYVILVLFILISSTVAHICYTQYLCKPSGRLLDDDSAAGKRDCEEV